MGDRAAPRLVEQRSHRRLLAGDHRASRERRTPRLVLAPPDRRYAIVKPSVDALTELHALSASGERLWSTRIPNRSRFVSIHNGRLVVTGPFPRRDGPEVRALDRDGDSVRAYELEGEVASGLIRHRCEFLVHGRTLQEVVGRRLDKGDARPRCQSEALLPDTRKRETRRAQVGAGMWRCERHPSGLAHAVVVHAPHAPAAHDSDAASNPFGIEFTPAFSRAGREPAVVARFPRGAARPALVR